MSISVQEDCPVISISDPPSPTITANPSDPPVASSEPEVSALASIVDGCNVFELMGDDFEKEDALEVDIVSSNNGTGK